MARGKEPPIKLTLTKSEKLHRLVYKEHGPAPVSPAQMAWLEKNCLKCEYRNVEKLVTATLMNEEMHWKHICLHRGPTKLLPLDDKKQGGVNCSGFEPEGGIHNNHQKRARAKYLQEAENATPNT